MENLFELEFTSDNSLFLFLFKFYLPSIYCLNLLLLFEEVRE